MTPVSARTLVSVVSPVYGCRECLPRLAEEVAAAFAGSGLDWELVLVDDRGPDRPWDVIAGLAARDPRVRGVRLMRNYGQHLAIWAGLAAARGDSVAVIDCDLQDDPSVIPELYRRMIAEEVDSVIVTRGDWSESRLRRAASRAFYALLASLTGIRIDNAGNFGLYSRRLVDVLLQFREQEVFLPAMVSLVGLPSARHALTRSQRAAGESAYSLRRQLRLAVSVIIRFSDRPLQLSVIVGLAFSLLAALASLVVLGLWLAGRLTVPGWTSTILSVWFLSGLIMAILGIHGFYLGRVFREVQARPRFLVECTTDRPGGEG